MKEETRKTIKTLFIAIAFAALGVALVAAVMPALAQTTMDHSKMADMKMADTAAVGMSDGEVRKIDKAQSKLTLKHGKIKSLNMPVMTMVFTAKDKAMLDGVKVGDKVRFQATNEGGKLVVVELAPAI